MTTSEERLKILTMVAEGKISPEEGAELLSALTESANKEPRAEPRLSSSDARWLRIRVTDLATGKAKVNINVPLTLVDMGLKIGARFAPEVHEMNLQEIAETIRSGLSGKIVDVTDEESGEHVEIYAE